MVPLDSCAGRAPRDIGDAQEEGPGDLEAGVGGGGSPEQEPPPASLVD